MDFGSLSSIINMNTIWEKHSFPEECETLDDKKRQIEEWLKQDETYIRQRLQTIRKAPPETTREEINRVIDSWKQKILEKEPNMSETEKAFLFPTIQPLNLSNTEQRKRNQLYEKANDTLTELFVRYKNDVTYQIFEKLYGPKDPATIKFGNPRVPMGLLFASGENITCKEMYENTDVEDKRRICQNSIKNMKEAIRVFSQDLTDEEFIDAVGKYGNALIGMVEAQGDQPRESLFEFFGVTPNEEDLKLLDDFKNNYADIAVTMGGYWKNRLGLIANPLYPTMETADMQRLSAAVSEANYKINEYFPPKTVDEPEPDIWNDLTTLESATRTNEKGYASQLKFIENSGDMDYLQSTYLLDTKGVTQVASGINSPTSQIVGYKQLLKYKLTIGDGKLPDNTVIYDENNQPITDYDKMTKDILVGKRLLYKTPTGETGDISLTANGSVGFVISQPAKTLTMRNGGRAEINEELMRDLKELGTINVHLISPTKEFTALAKTLDAFKQENVYSMDEKQFKAKIAEAVGHAKDYLDNKMKTTKTFTAKTNARIAFAKRFVEKFERMADMDAITKEPTTRWDKEALAPSHIVLKEIGVELHDIMKEYIHTEPEKKLVRDIQKEEQKKQKYISSYKKTHDGAEPPQDDPKLNSKFTKRQLEEGKLIQDEMASAKQRFPVTKAKMICLYSSLHSLIQQKETNLGNPELSDPYFKLEKGHLNEQLNNVGDYLISGFGVTRKELREISQKTPEEIHQEYGKIIKESEKQEPAIEENNVIGISPEEQRRETEEVQQLLENQIKSEDMSQSEDELEQGLDAHKEIDQVKESS